MNPIFARLPLELNENIFSFCNTKSLTELSGVNKSANDLFSNGVFFKDRFYCQHPDLKRFDKVFLMLRRSHPDNCWKVICQIKDPVNSDGHFSERFRFSFVELAVSKKIVLLESQKSKWVIKIKDVCGEHYADPRSSIDQAWKEWNEYQLQYVAQTQENIQLNEQMDLLVEKLKTIHSEDEVKIIQLVLFNICRDFQEITEEGFMNMPQAERKGMLKEHFSLYREYARTNLRFEVGTKKLFSLGLKIIPAQRKYLFLEVGRTTTEEQILHLNQEIEAYQSDPCGSYKRDVSNVCCSVQRLENALKNKPRLEECLQLIQKLVDGPLQRTPENLDRIRFLINACPHEAKKSIWGTLYFLCANYAIEDAWSEKHFQDFLPELSVLVKNIVTSYQDAIKNAEIYWISKQL